MDDVDEFERKVARRKRLNLGILVGIAALGLGMIAFTWWRSHRRDVQRDDERAESRRRAEERRHDGARTVEERAARAAELDRLVIEAIETDAAFQSTIRATLRTAPHTTGNCPVSLQDLQVRYLEQGRELDGTRFADSLRRAVVEGHADLLLRGHSPNARRSERTRYELVLGVTKRREPMFVGRLFLPGGLAGRAVLWDSADRRVVCVGDVDVENTDEIHYKIDAVRSTKQEAETARSAIDHDLERRTVNAISERLRAVRDGLAVKSRE
ncbi:MAG: hypothetical protein ABI867_33840 [Kofleriaceae bacterium]